MRPFRFRPQRVLDWRHQETDQARLGLARALVAWRRAERTAQTAMEQRRAWELDMQRRRLAGQTVRDWERDWWTLATLRAAEAAARAGVTRALEWVAEGRSRLQAARRRSRSLELLRERRWAEHHQAELSWQQQELDEWVTTKGIGRTPWPAEG